MGLSLQVENLSACLSSLRYFEYRPFISSKDHAKPHISYIAGQGMMSAVIWRCQWQRQIQSASNQRPNVCYSFEEQWVEGFQI